MSASKLQPCAMSSQAVCIFDKCFATFQYLTRKNSHTNKMHVNWHAHFRFWHVVWLVKEKTNLTLYKLRMTRITRHVEHWGEILDENVSVTWHSFLFMENVMWHFGFEDERQMKFVKHTHWSQELWSSSSAPLFSILGRSMLWCPVPTGPSLKWKWCTKQAQEHVYFSNLGAFRLIILK